MTPSLPELFRTLTAFAPVRRSLEGAPWEEFVDWAIGQGLAPLAAYNLEYALAGGGAPDWARDRLLSIYQGSVNDNVMKLVNFKRSVDALEGRKVILFGGASFAESLYPHIAFRPVIDLQLLLRAPDVDGFANFLRTAEFRTAPQEQQGEAGARRVLTDGRTNLLLYSGLLGEGRADAEAGLFDRALPMKVYGPSFFRLDLEDAILVACLEHAREGYQVPLIQFVDLRELLLGAPALGGPYSRPVDAGVLLARARELRLERALYASTAIVAALFPDAADAARRVQPRIPAATRALLDRALVQPVGTLGKTSRVRGAERLRRLLAGGA